MKIFVLLSRVPYPLDKGDKLRAYHQLKGLAQHHEIHLFCLDDGKTSQETIVRLQEFCKTVHIHSLSAFGRILNVILAFLTGKPLHCGYFYSTTAKNEIRKQIEGLKPDHIYCQLIRVAAYVATAKIPKTLDYQDVFSMGMKRRMEAAPSLLKLFYYAEYRRLLRYETWVFDQFDNKTIITDTDRQLIPHPRKNDIHIIPNGVDFQTFYPIAGEKSYDLIFTGNMSYAPNIDAAIYLATEIMPLVWKHRPECRLLLAGATPHASVIALQNDKITVSGWIPEMRTAYASAKIFIAPMRIGTGLQNKLLEAMAIKIPCITSPLAFEALGAEAGTEILLATAPQEYADKIEFLLANPDKAVEIGEAGYIFVQRKYDWQTATALLEKIILETPIKTL